MFDAAGHQCNAVNKDVKAGKGKKNINKNAGLIKSMACSTIAFFNNIIIIIKRSQNLDKSERIFDLDLDLFAPEAVIVPPFLSFLLFIVELMSKVGVVNMVSSPSVPTHCC